MKSLFILLAAVLFTGCSVMTSDFSEMRRNFSTDKIIAATEEKPTEKAEGTAVEEPSKPVEEVIPEPAIEEPAEEPAEEPDIEEAVVEEAVVEETEVEETEEIAAEEAVKTDQNPEPETDIIIEEKETIFVETGSLKISGDSESYTISDGDEIITLKKEEIDFGFWQRLDSGFIYYDGISGKICYTDGSTKIPLE